MRLVASAATVLAAAVLGACSTAHDVEQSGVASCARCHGFPPEQVSSTGEPHPSSASCSECHAETVSADGEIIAGGAHMNGRVDATGGHVVPFVSQHTAAALTGIASCKACHGQDYGGSSDAPSCNACHQAPAPDGADFAGDWRTNCTFCHGGGDAGRDAGWSGILAEAAPPQTVAGPLVDPDQTSANAKVGAHQRHLVAGSYSGPIACDACHGTVPSSLAHVDGTLSIQFSALARQRVATPGYAGGGGSCAVYCHGSTPELGDNTSPAWTGTIGCGSCHTTAPTSGFHTFHLTSPRNVACAKCHLGYSTDPETVSTATHVDGAFQASVQANAAATPPTHDAELSDPTPTWPSQCAACHVL